MNEIQKRLKSLVNAHLESKLSETELFRRAQNLGFTENAVRDMLPAPPFAQVV